jgi:hypothetical protein
MLRKLGIVTAAVLVVIGVGMPATANVAHRKATVAHTVTKGGVTFTLTGEASDVQRGPHWDTVQATCTAVVVPTAALLAPIEPTCYVYDLTSGIRYEMFPLQRMWANASAMGIFEVREDHRFQLCVGASVLIPSGWVTGTAPCRALANGV